MVLNRLLSAGFDIRRTPRCVVALMVSLACLRDIFHLDTRCSGVIPARLDVEVAKMMRLLFSIALKDASLRVASILFRILSVFSIACVWACSEFNAAIDIGGRVEVTDVRKRQSRRNFGSPGGLNSPW